jgi:ABC-type uncharacterized transport system permease subunit
MVFLLSAVFRGFAVTSSTRPLSIGSIGDESSEATEFVRGHVALRMSHAAGRRNWVLLLALVFCVEFWVFVTSTVVESL